MIGVVFGIIYTIFYIRNSSKQTQNQIIVQQVAPPTNPVSVAAPAPAPIHDTVYIQVPTKPVEKNDKANLAQTTDAPSKEIHPDSSINPFEQNQNTPTENGQRSNGEYYSYSHTETNSTTIYGHDGKILNSRSNTRTSTYSNLPSSVNPTSNQNYQAQNNSSNQSLARQQNIANSNNLQGSPDIVKTWNGPVATVGNSYQSSGSQSTTQRNNYDPNRIYIQRGYGGGSYRRSGRR